MEEKRFGRAIGRNLWKNRILWLYGVATLTSFAIFVVFWCTNAFRDAILTRLELRNGTSTFEWWQRPPVLLLHKVYVFNYTNVKEFESGKASKLRVQETGPYVYAEELNRVNVRLHENGTVSYQEKRSFRWVAGKPDNVVVVAPNVPLMSTLAYSRNIIYAARIGLTAILSALRTKTFVELPVGELLWGYDDNIFRMAKPFISMKQSLPFDKFGLLASKNGLSEDRITMHTGVGDLRNLGQIQRINGMEVRRIWGKEECDRVRGTDGSMFSPYSVDQPNATLYVYAKDICRTMPLRYEGRRLSNGIPVLRYEIPRDVFASTGDSCFCAKKSQGDPRTESSEEPASCPPAGIFNISACNFGSPLLLSFPHFYSADESVFNEIDGLDPRREHRSYVDLHPRLALAIAGYSRIQLNLEVRTAASVPFSGKLKDGAILPLIWIDSGMDEISESMRELLLRAHYGVDAVEAGVQWCSLVSFLLFFGALIRALRRDEGKAR